MDKHITNLESEDHILTTLANAEAALSSIPEDATQDRAKANATLVHAKLLADGWKNTMDLIKREHGDVIVGKPRGTKWRTASQLEAQGLVGIYLP